MLHPSLYMNSLRQLRVVGDLDLELFMELFTWLLKLMLDKQKQPAEIQSLQDCIGKSSDVKFAIQVKHGKVCHPESTLKKWANQAKYYFCCIFHNNKSCYNVLIRDI